MQRFAGHSPSNALSATWPSLGLPWKTSNDEYLIRDGDDALVQRHDREEEVLGIVDVERRHRPVAVLDPRADCRLLKERSHEKLR